MAGRGQKAGLCLVRSIGKLLGLLERKLYFASGLEFPLQPQVELFVLFGALPDRLFEAGGGLKPRKRAALLVNRLLDPLHECLHRLFQGTVLGAQPWCGGRRPYAAGLARCRRRPGALRRFAHQRAATPKQVKELFAWMVLNCSPREANPVTECACMSASMRLVRPSRSI